MKLKLKMRMWGNRLGMRIPEPIAEQMQLSNGTILEFEIDGQNLQQGNRPAFVLNPSKIKVF